MTDVWKPANKEDVLRAVDDDLLRCSPDQRRLFETIRVPPEEVRVQRGEAIETVILIGRTDDRVIWFEDIHDAFEITAPDADGILRPTSIGMFELSHILHQLAGDAG